MKLSSKPDISIIIVNYNSSDLLADCIESIFSTIRSKIEIIVFDNASCDDSIAKAVAKAGNDNRLILIKSGENIGFAKANNRAAATAKGRFFHFLNPDTKVNSGLDKEYEVLLRGQNRGIFVSGIMESDGSVHKMKHLIPTLGNYFKALVHKPKAGYWNIGASIITDRITFQTLGGWAEDYFMYAEDLDFFYLAVKKNVPVSYLDTSVTHIGRGITSKIWNPLERLILIEKSTRRFYQKYRMGYQYFLIRPLQLIYILMNEPDEFRITAKAFRKSLIK